MTNSVFLLLLLAAALHAAWNALVKKCPDRLAAASLVTVTGGVCALGALPFVGPLPLSAAPLLLVSSLIHASYMLILARAYDKADFSQFYPLARGGGPLCVALATVILWPGRLGNAQLGGILLIVLGVWAMMGDSWRQARKLDLPLLGHAASISVLIAAYTLLDSAAARACGSALRYTFWLTVSTALLVSGANFIVRPGMNPLPAWRAVWKTGVLAGLMALAGFCIVIWAMTRAPVALVAALRESSILFSGAIAAFFLREKLLPARLLSAALLLGGILLIRFAA